MAEFLYHWGNLLFHIRNVLFPVLMVLLLLIWPPVAIDAVRSAYLMMVGVVLIVLGQCLRILTIGLSYIIRGGQKRRIYAEKLVTDGVFHHSRNPLYVGNLLIIFGFIFIAGNLTGILAGSLIFMVIYRLIVHSEETFLQSKFNDAYKTYCANVPRWIPRFAGLRQTISQYQFDWPAVAVKEYGTIMTSLMVPLGLFAWKLNLSGKLGDYHSLLLVIAFMIMTAYATVRFLKKTERLKAMR